MKIRTAKSSFTRQGYTLVELLVATALGALLAGGVLFLLFQTSSEQRNGFADMTVEQQAYTLQSQITSCLRSASANQGLTPDYTSGLFDTNGNFLGYQSVFVFTPNNGTYTTASITYNSTNGTVIYTANMANPTPVVWATNSSTATLTQLCFTTSLNLDGSHNSSLVNVIFQMNDNGFSGQTGINDPTSIYRNFSVQMRNDN